MLMNIVKNFVAVMFVGGVLFGFWFMIYELVWK